MPRASRLRMLIPSRFDRILTSCYSRNAGWSSLVARWAHNPKVGGSNPPPATNSKLFPFNSFQSGDKKLNERLALDSLSLSQTLSGLIWQSKGRKLIGPIQLCWRSTLRDESKIATSGA